MNRIYPLAIAGMAAVFAAGCGGQSELEKVEEERETISERRELQRERALLNLEQQLIEGRITRENYEMAKERIEGEPIQDAAYEIVDFSGDVLGRIVEGTAGFVVKGVKGTAKLAATGIEETVEWGYNNSKSAAKAVVEDASEGLDAIADSMTDLPPGTLRGEFPVGTTLSGLENPLDGVEYLAVPDTANQGYTKVVISKDNAKGRDRYTMVWRNGELAFRGWTTGSLSDPTYLKRDNKTENAPTYHNLVGAIEALQ